ncbi:MAG: peroxidase [Candidatus Wallbacteria bacterium]|nr:peroxidase [Candidatus Wallbacteria bacterium]
MLHFAVKLTRTPAEMRRADVELLRQIGHDDRSIHDIAAVTAYFNFVNRLALGLGVELESDWAEPEAGKRLRRKRPAA